MRRAIIILLAGFLCLNILQAQQISLEDITAQKYAEKMFNEFVSSSDGEYYYQANADKTMIVRYAFKTASPVDTVFNAKRARECPFNAFEGFLLAPDGKRLLLYTGSEPVYRRSFRAVYYYYDIRRNLVQKLTDNSGKQQAPVFSKDGRMLAYVANNNIWLAKFDYDTETQITKDGLAGSIINGATDWVYEEEFGITCLMDFSPDNKLLAFVRFDETAVPQFSFQDYKHDLYPQFRSFKYPKAGEANSKVSCQVFDVEARTTRLMSIPSPQTEYIPRIQFVSESQLAVMTLNREQNDFNMYYVNPRSAVSRLILHEANDKYISDGLIPSVHFFADGFVYLSEKSGYSHIYGCSHSGSGQKQLTSGEYDVTKIVAVNPNTKTVFYEAADENPLRRSVCKVDMQKGTKSKLSVKAGYNSATFGQNGTYFINRWSDANTPALVTLHDATGKLLKTLEDNSELKSKIAKLNLSSKEFITIKSADGSELNAWLKKPAGFNPARKYPLVMVQYSGPGSQEVLDKFTVDWTDYLVTQGFVAACVDGHGTGGRGEAFGKSTCLHLGVKEAEDQIAAAGYFASLPYIDGGRIGIWGWSYGGYNVLMSMSRSKIFKAGVSIAPVTDWRFYNSVYTERYMRTPQQNHAGYTDGSAVALAGNLSGNLLLIHGSADDNVHFQNTMEYADALIAANKQFDLFVFPDRNHSILGERNRTYLYKKVVDFFGKNL
ncbi:MAG: DPP IV N-terminal domain-containing protein [Prevotella sp.]|jgi:dipeptidyl-peptidase-4|nr:DPP IV N-terminal domain-containing protein [Prevotella sp.]